MTPWTAADEGRDVCACGHDVTDHATGYPVGCIHCRNCTEFADRSTYVSRFADAPEMTDEIAAAIFDALNTTNPLHYDDAAEDLADALLPTVRALMDQAAAKALEDAADEVGRFSGPQAPDTLRDYLRDRARALTATEETP